MQAEFPARRLPGKIKTAKPLRTGIGSAEIKPDAIVGSKDTEFAQACFGGFPRGFCLPDDAGGSQREVPPHSTRRHLSRSGPLCGLRHRKRSVGRGGGHRVRNSCFNVRGLDASSAPTRSLARGGYLGRAESRPAVVRFFPVVVPVVGPARVGGITLTLLDMVRSC